MQTKRIISSPIRLTGRLHPAQLFELIATDTLIREASLVGDNIDWSTLALSGDLALQHAVERELVRQGIDRQTLGKEDFEVNVQSLEVGFLDGLTHLLKSLNVGADVHSAPPGSHLSHIALTAFVRLYEQGVLEKRRLVADTCPRCETVIGTADINTEEFETERFTVALPIVDGDSNAAEVPASSVDVEIIELELILGAVAISVPEGHEAVGQYARLPIAERTVPIIAKANSDEPAIVVPGHVSEDYEFALKLNLAPIEVIDLDGTVYIDGPLDGLTRHAARAALRKLIEAENLVKSARLVDTQVSRCRRCSTNLVSRLGDHWMLIGDLGKAGSDLVEEGSLSFSSSSARDLFLESASTMGEWCLSHQLSYGLQVPVAACIDCGREAVAAELPQSCLSCMGTLLPDDGVLDAQFIGSLWPLEAIGWPDRDAHEADAETTAFTAGDRGITTWCVPMVALSLYLNGSVPFSRVISYENIADRDLEYLSLAKVSELLEAEGSDVLRLAVLGGSMDIDWASTVVGALSDPLEGDANLNALVDRWRDAIADDSPADALSVLAETLDQGIDLQASDQLRDLAVPLLGN